MEHANLEPSEFEMSPGALKKTTGSCVSGCHSLSSTTTGLYPLTALLFLSGQEVECRCTMGNAILQWAQSTQNKGINSEPKIPGATGNHFVAKTFRLSCFNHNFLRGKIKLQTSHDLGVP